MVTAWNAGPGELVSDRPWDAPDDDDDAQLQALLEENAQLMANVAEIRTRVAGTCGENRQLRRTLRQLAEAAAAAVGLQVVPVPVLLAVHAEDDVPF
jgi:hypothetical protein